MKIREALKNIRINSLGIFYEFSGIDWILNSETDLLSIYYTEDELYDNKSPRYTIRLSEISSIPEDILNIEIESELLYKYEVSSNFVIAYIIHSTNKDGSNIIDAKAKFR